MTRVLLSSLPLAVNVGDKQVGRDNEPGAAMQTTPGSSCRLSLLPRPDDRARLDGTKRNNREIQKNAAQISVHMLSPRGPKTSSVSRTWTANRLGVAGSRLASTTEHLAPGDRGASGQTVACRRTRRTARATQLP
jgi:hypothetical protein